MYCIVANDPYILIFIFSELHIGSCTCIRYENTLFGNCVLKCYIVKIILLSFNCFSEYTYGVIIAQVSFFVYNSRGCTFYHFLAD